jgi:hypothetical protein
MDVFSRTFLPATSEAGIPIPVVSRHMPVLRRCVAPEDTTLLVSRCQRPGQPMAGSFLLLLTNRYLVISRESRLLRRIQLHLAAQLRDLSDVSWVADARLCAVELAATASDGVRERFWIPVRDERRVSHVDARFGHAFRSRTVAPHREQGLASRTALRYAPRLVSSAGAI